MNWSSEPLTMADMIDVSLVQDPMTVAADRYNAAINLVSRRGQCSRELLLTYTPEKFMPLLADCMKSLQGAQMATDLIRKALSSE